MSENTKIEWATHTSKTRHPFIGMRHPMAVFAKRFPIANIKTTFGVIGKWKDVMGLKVSTSVVPAVNAYEAVALHHRKSPSAPFWGGPQIFALAGFPVHVAAALLPFRGSFPGALADKCARLWRVLHAGAVAPSRPGRRTHFCAAFGGHD